MQIAEQCFEKDMESFFLSLGGYTKGTDTYDAELGLYVNTLIDFIQRTQPEAWACFANGYRANAKRKFCLSFNNACDEEGLLSVLRHGFYHRKLHFWVYYCKPESGSNRATVELWTHNKVECYRQRCYSADMVLALNGIPVFELKPKRRRADGEEREAAAKC